MKLGFIISKNIHASIYFFDTCRRIPLLRAHYSQTKKSKMKLGFIIIQNINASIYFFYTCRRIPLHRAHYSQTKKSKNETCLATSFCIFV